MKIRALIVTIVIAICAAAAGAQDIDPAARATAWREFNKNGFERINFAKVRLTQTRVAKLKADGDVDQIALLRGVVFGKRGRVFKERSIQDYLDKQAWYKPNKGFSNSILTPAERANLDLIRLAEAKSHPVIEPGDMRIWKAKLITDDNLR